MLFLGILSVLVISSVISVFLTRSGKIATIIVAIAVIFVGSNMITTVDAGKIKIGKLFGAMQEGYYGEGLHFVNPMLSLSSVNTRRQSLDFSGENSAQGASSDPIRLVVDVTVPFIINPEFAWQVVQKYGDENTWNVITPNSRRAIRDCTSQQTWTGNMSSEGRQILSDCITERIPVLIADDLISTGIDEKIAKKAITISPAIIREIRPTDERLLKSIAEKESAKQDLERQETLTEIAAQEANRRENEGLGVAKMMAKLPKDYAISDMVSIIKANSAKLHAEAFMKAVENGNPNISIVVDGSGNVGVTKAIK